MTHQQVHAVVDPVDALKHPIWVLRVLKVQHYRFVLHFLEGQNALRIVLVSEEDGAVVALTTVIGSGENGDAVRVTLPVVALELVTGYLDLVGAD